MTEIAFRVVKEWDVVTVRITEIGKKRADALTAQGCCLGCEEKHQPDVPAKCGLCPTCYQAVLRAEKAGRVTRNALIREGRMLTPGKSGPKPANKFTQELAGR